MTSQMFGITLPEATRRFYPFTQTQDPPQHEVTAHVMGWGILISWVFFSEGSGKGQKMLIDLVDAPFFFH